ncbi:cbb3-type cytochrome c oxidase subunit 3 [Tibeticola sp.]|jgi:cytochrome c oxidase cbb3-type subunit 4|nr:cbb3-type cytochrome c oxidase subunit 3 [Tibeticola sp.]QLQ00788.1 MAG: CcoQ/FixQ family Cbb3-type cytochrome c oxidase assembly chaperone [Burkholderiaceae bacterium]
MDFDINTLRSLTTVLSFVLFIGIFAWAWSRKRTKDFEEAANLPFEQD